MINKIFQYSAKHHPKNIAMQYQEHLLSYEELEAHANQFANFLLSYHKIEKGQRIVIKIDNPLWRTIAFLACAKIGAVYVPISKKKKDNIAYIQNVFKSCSPALALSSSKENPQVMQQFKITSFDAKTIDAITQQPTMLRNAPIINDYEDLLYIIHSSGTSGAPKGVPIANAGMKYWGMTLINAWKKNDTNPGVHNVLGNANPDFDVHIWEMLMAWIVGGTVHFTGDQQRNHVNQLIHFLVGNHITDATLTPSVVHLFSDNDFLMLKKSGLKNLYVTGEACTLEIAKKCQAAGINLYNCYGSTEETFGLSIRLCKPNEFYRGIAPIAAPENQEIITIIVDDKGDPVADGQEGELVVISPYITKGYIPDHLNDGETIQRILKNGQLYGRFKTGDKFVKHNGNLYFLGRTSDLQDIKINGQKVNVTGINNVLRNNPYVKDCAVVLKHKPKSKKPYLVAYIVADEKSNITVMKLREWGKKYLSSYEIPTHFVFVKSLPQTDNGKTNFKKLKNSPTSFPRTKRTPPYLPSKSQIEYTTCRIAEETLEFPEKISLADPIEFISPNSIDFMTLISDIEEHYEIDELSDELLKNKNPEVKHLTDAVYRLLVAKKSRSVLKKVKEGNSDLDPIIIVHPVTGESSHLYRTLYSNLDTNREIYVINAPTLKDNKLVTDSIETIASTYLDIINKEIPRCRDGSYTLLTYSSGAYIAKEMCVQSEKKGNNLNQVMIIDEPAVSPLKNIHAHKFDNMLFQFISDLRREMGNMFDIPPKSNKIWKNIGMLSSKEDKIHQLFSNIIKYNANNDCLRAKNLKKFFVNSLIHVQFLLAAELKYNNNTILSSDMQLFAADSTTIKYRDEDMGWKNMTHGAMNVHVYKNTNHFNLLENKKMFKDINDALKIENKNGMKHIKHLLNQMNNSKSLDAKDREELSQFIQKISLNHKTSDISFGKNMASQFRKHNQSKVLHAPVLQKAKCKL